MREPGPSFPWLPSFQSTSQARNMAVEEEAVAPAPSWCQDTTPRPRKSSILGVGQGLEWAHLGRTWSLPLFRSHAFLLSSPRASSGLTLPPSLLSLQLPKLQILPTYFLPIIIYFIELVCNQGICVFKSFTQLRITGLDYLVVLYISQYIILWWVRWEENDEKQMENEDLLVILHKIPHYSLPISLYHSMPVTHKSFLGLFQKFMVLCLVFSIFSRKCNFMTLLDWNHSWIMFLTPCDSSVFSLHKSITAITQLQRA